MSVEDARAKIADRIAKATGLGVDDTQSDAALEAARHQYWTWNDYNRELLRQIATNEELSVEYAHESPIFVISEQSFWDKVDDLRTDVRSKVHRLNSISERLELIPMADDMVARLDTPAVASAHAPTKVFIVHGHDEAAREKVARFIERLHLEPVILHEQPNEGMTVIEKLEHYSAGGFAVVLLTADDEGRKVGHPQLQTRPRQNVVMELGYFLGKFGRKRVCALAKGVHELPSDFLGVVYVPFDEGGGWQLRLAKELRAANFKIDMNEI